MADRNRSSSGYGEGHDWQRNRDESWQLQQSEGEFRGGRGQSDWQNSQPSQSSYGAEGGGWHGGSESWDSQQRQHGNEHGVQPGGQSGSYGGGSMRAARKYEAAISAAAMEQAAGAMSVAGAMRAKAIADLKRRARAMDRAADSVSTNRVAGTVRKAATGAAANAIGTAVDKPREAGAPKATAARSGLRGTGRTRPLRFVRGLWFAHMGGDFGGHRGQQGGFGRGGRDRAGSRSKWT